MIERFENPVSQILRDFLGSGGLTLFIKGEPGSGKTIFALELSKLMSEFTDVFFVSTRVSPERIMLLHPWTKDFLQRGKVLDATRSMSLVNGRGRMIGGKGVHELILSIKYEDRPSFIKSLLELVKSAEKDSKPLLVIDSIEAVERIVKAPLVEDLIKISEELGIYLLLVSERVELSESDFFVDGIIELKKEISEGATLRKAVIRKMRGVGIKQPEYLFTLKEGRFGVFPPFSFKPPGERRLFEPIQDPDENHFSSGSRDLDEIFGGGFRKGSSLLLEISEGVTKEMYYQIASVFTLNFLRNGRRVFVLYSLGVDKEEILENYINPYINESERELLIDLYKKFLEDELRRGFKVDPKKIFNEKWSSHDALNVTGMDHLHSIYQEEVNEFVRTESDFVRKSKSLALRIVKPGFPFLRELSNLSNIHIKIENICGVPVIRGLRPRTQYYGMTLNFSSGYPKLGFTQVE